jgi:hypothetical protein
VAPKDTTRPPGSGQHLTAPAQQQRQQQPNAMIGTDVDPFERKPSTPNCLLRELACFGYWLVHHGLQLGSSGEIEDKDLSRAVGFDRDLVRCPFELELWRCPFRVIQTVRAAYSHSWRSSDRSGITSQVSIATGATVNSAIRMTIGSADGIRSERMTT